MSDSGDEVQANSPIPEERDLLGEPDGFEIREYKGHRIAFRRRDRYANGTAMCSSVGKVIKDYLRNQETQDFLAALARSIGIPIDLDRAPLGYRGDCLVQMQTTGPNHLRGTWVHARVAYNLGQWCNPEFAVWVTEILDELAHKGVVALAPSQPAEELFLLLRSAVRQDVGAEVQRRVEPIAEKLERLFAWMVKHLTEQWKPFPPFLRAYAIAVHRKYFGDACLACGRVVFDGDGHFLGDFDHWNGNGLDIRLGNLMMLCQHCNRHDKREDPERFRLTHRRAYEAFQEHLHRDRAEIDRYREAP